MSLSSSLASRIALATLSAALLAGCGSTGTSGSQGGGGAGGASHSSGAGGAAAGAISIFVQGDLTDPSFKDGLSGQTPTDYQIAVSRYQVLRSAADPVPVLCFDLGGAAAISNLPGDNLVGSCPTAAVPTGVYTHGRTKVDWARYSVEGTYHAQGTALPGVFTFFRAYSDGTYEGKAYKAGEGKVAFKGAVSAEYPLVYGAPVDAAGVHFDVANGELSMTFQFTHPLPIDQKNTLAHWARFHWSIFDAFRWTDSALPGYQPNVWDVAATGTETVAMYGFSGYFVTSSVD